MPEAIDMRGYTRALGPFELDNWFVDPAAREVSNGGRVRRLSPRAMGVLAMLAEAGGAVVTRECLLDGVWPDVHVGDESLTQAVAELRRALRDGSGQGQLVETVPKAGYRLTVPVAPRTLTASSTPIHDRLDELPLSAHLAVARARQLRWLHGYAATGEMKQLMDEAIGSAPSSACVQAEYAMLVGCTVLHRGDSAARLDAAVAAAQRAVALRPDLVKAHCAHGFVSGLMGRLDDCTRSFQRAFALDPADAETHSLAAQAFFGLGQMETALILAENAASLDSEDILPPYVAARTALALGQRARAEVAARMCLSRADVRLMLTPDSVRASSVRAAALGMLGRDEEAIAETARDGVEADFRDMVALASAGERTAALDVLETMLSAGWRVSGWLTRDPVFCDLVNEPRYGRLAGYVQAA